MKTNVDYDGAVNDIKTRLAAAQRARARAEHERDAAAAAAQAARDQLAADFAVTTIEQAKTMLTALEADLATEIAALGAALDEMEAPAP